MIQLVCINFSQNIAFPLTKYTFDLSLVYISIYKKCATMPINGTSVYKQHANSMAQIIKQL